ncbi:MAG: efflux transporter periplasmic adaptor subunit [Pedobacter sp.]|nr:efflux transporter periplasmic adaptor subunit [Pedobacter sp.]
MNKIKIIVLLFCLSGVMACKQKSQQQPTANMQSKAYYTCSMHPQVHENKPGNCPICGMKLIKVESATNTGNNKPGLVKITLTASQMQLAGIQTDTVREQNTGVEKTVSGTVSSNENRTSELSARIGGRIQRLFVKTVGETIAIGQPVYALYSEDLQEVQKEYLLARQQHKVLNNPDVDYRQLISAAEDKLKLLGLSAKQITNLAASGKTSSTINILSTVNGTVTEIAVHEGDYVTEGSPILKTQDLNSLWVEAQLYANEAGKFKVGGVVTLYFPDLGNQAINGKVEFVNPELSDASKVNLVRVSVANTHGLIKPGMLAYIAISSGSKKTLAIPASAILSDGRGDRVWLRNSDGSFSPQAVKTAVGNSSFIPIVAGIKAGDVIVTSGVYLLNSEAIFKNGNDQSTTKN